VLKEAKGGLSWKMRIDGFISGNIYDGTKQQEHKNAETKISSNCIRAVDYRLCANFRDQALGESLRRSGFLTRSAYLYDLRRKLEN
jgi:hypothetical protein